MNFQELKAIALANPKGRILSGASDFIKPICADFYNCGNWDGTDSTRDAIGDVLRGLARLNNIPRYMLMHPATYSNFVRAIGFDQLYQFGAVFGCAPHDRSWLFVRDECENGIVLIVARHQSEYVNPDDPDPTVVYIDTR